MLKLSVIIPVCNAAPYVRGCLASVLGQTLREIEVVCVDDGSTDGSGAILDDLAATDARVRVVHQANAGQGAARNRGLERASGAFVYFMDADDGLAGTDVFARLIAEMESANLEVLLFDAETRVDAGAETNGAVRAADYIRTQDYSSVRTGRALMARMLGDRAFTVSPCLMMLRRDFVEAHALRFPGARIFYEDNIFMTRVMLAATRASHRPWRLFVRRVHAGSTVTSRPTLRHLRGYLACYLDARDVLARGGWDRRTQHVLRERMASYKLGVRRIADARADLVAAAREEMDSDEYRAFLDVRRYPLSEKIVNGWRCLRDHGPAYTLARMLFGRRS